MKVFALTLLAACSANEKVYEETIAGYLQTDECGKWTDLGFKILSMKTKACTVGECIRILIDDAEMEKRQAIAAEEASLQMMKQQMEEKIKSEFLGKMFREIYEKEVAYSEQRIRALEKAIPAEAGLYKGLDPEMLLGIRVTCTYRISIPWGNARHEQTDSFLLTPDGKKVIGTDPRDHI